MFKTNEKYQDEVEKLLEVGKEKEYLTYDDINRLLPVEMNSAEEIEAIFEYLGAEGISISDSDEKLLETLQTPIGNGTPVTAEEVDIIPVPHHGAIPEAAKNNRTFLSHQVNSFRDGSPPLPGFSEHLILLFVSKEDGENILGDLQEEFIEVFLELGQTKAKLWFHKQVFTSVFQIAYRALLKMVFDKAREVIHRLIP